MDQNYLMQLGVSSEAAEKILTAHAAALAQQEKQYQQQLEQERMRSALEIAVNEVGAYDAKAVIPFLRMDTITFQNDAFTGLREQLELLRQTKSFLFREEAKNPVKAGGCRTGLSHGGLSALSPSAMTDAQYYATFRK